MVDFQPRDGGSPFFTEGWAHSSGQVLGRWYFSKQKCRTDKFINMSPKYWRFFAELLLFTFILLIYALAKTLRCNSGYSRHSGNYNNGIFCHWKPNESVDSSKFLFLFQFIFSPPVSPALLLRWGSISQSASTRILPPVITPRRQVFSNQGALYGHSMYHHIISFQRG